MVSREYCHKSAPLPRESRDPPEHGATAEGSPDGGRCLRQIDRRTGAMPETVTRRVVNAEGAVVPITETPMDHLKITQR